MSSGAEPIPIEFPDGPPEGGVDLMLVIKEAFRQGWASARHWPNHPLPQQLFVRLDINDPETYVLRIEWP